MGDIIKFPGQFHGPEIDPPDEKSKNALEHTSGDIEANEAADKIEQFIIKVAEMRSKNKHILWFGATARDTDILVRGYTTGELETWATNATDFEINQKPLFFSSIQEELLRRLEIIRQTTKLEPDSQ